MDISKRLLCFLAVLLCLILAANTSHGQIFTSISPVYYSTDLVGSPVAQTDENGDLLWKVDRFPYGQEFEPEPTSLNETVGYAGHVYDRDTKLVYMQARYYDPFVGRFMGIDPVGFTASNPMSFNRYAYANNNPYRYTDPDGRSPLAIEGAIGGTIACGPICGGIGFAGGLAVTALGMKVLSDSMNDSADSSGQESEGEVPRFIVDSDGNTVDTDVTPEGTSWQQPDGGRTDILQGEDHGAGRSHTHDPKINTNPKTGESFVNGLTKPGRGVSGTDIENITSGKAVPAKPKGR